MRCAAVRLAVVGALTALGQLIAFLLLPAMAHTLPTHDMVAIATVETSFSWLVTAITLGLQHRVTREVAIAEDWRSEVQAARAAMLSLGLMAAAIGLVGAVWSGGSLTMFVMVVAPAVALNADFALYGHGSPVTAAILALFRSAFPVGALLLLVAVVKGFAYHPIAFILALALAQLISGTTVVWRLDVKFAVAPTIAGLRLYLASFGLGLASLALSTIRLIPVVVAGACFAPAEAVLVYGFFKILALFIGGRRLLLQTFYRDLKRPLVKQRIDRLGLFAGATCAAVLVVLDDTIAELIFPAGSKHGASAIDLAALACLASSFFITSGTSLLLERRDRAYALCHLGAVALLAVAMLASAVLYSSTLLFLAGLVAVEGVLAISTWATLRAG